MIATPHCCRRLLLLFLGSAFSIISYSQSLNGKVFDMKTGEPLAGATVHLVNTQLATIVNLDGSYSFKHLIPGQYKVEVTLVGYKKVPDQQVTVGKESETRQVNFLLENAATELNEVIVAGS